MQDTFLQMFSKCECLIVFFELLEKSSQAQCILPNEDKKGFCSSKQIFLWYF